MEVAIEGSNGSFHSHRQWKLPCTALEASINFHGSKFTCMEIPWKLVETCMEFSMGVGGSFHRNGSNGSR